MMPMRKTKDIDEWNERKSWKKRRFWCMRKSNNFFMFSFFRDDYFELSSLRPVSQDFSKLFSVCFFLWFNFCAYNIGPSSLDLNCFSSNDFLLLKKLEKQAKIVHNSKTASQIVSQCMEPGRGSVFLTQFFIWNSQLLRRYLRVIGPVRPAAAQQLRNYCIHILHGS